MEYLGAILFIIGLFTGLVAFVWRDTQKRIEKGIAAAMPRELCTERHENLDQKIEEMRTDLKKVLQHLAKMNGEEEG